MSLLAMILEDSIESKALLWIGAGIAAAMMAQWALLTVIWSEIKEMRKDVQSNFVNHEVRIVKLESRHAPRS